MAIQDSRIEKKRALSRISRMGWLFYCGRADEGIRISFEEGGLSGESGARRVESGLTKETSEKVQGCLSTSFLAA